MATALDAHFVARYARGPSATTREQAISLHTNIRDLLGDGEYATLLQGSYKNETALWDMNDVDILAVDRRIRSGPFSSGGGPGDASWDSIFNKVEAKLESSPRYAGKWQRKDKCIQVNTGITVDVVPAVYISTPTADPVAIHSFRERRERPNWPRDHYSNGSAKSGRTNGAYKPAVRLFKRWAKCWFTDESKVAPSYYLECLVYSRPNREFSGDLAMDFLRMAGAVVRLNHSRETLPRIAGPGDLFHSTEWDHRRFSRFQTGLRGVLPDLRAALSALDQASARAHWVRAFNGQTP